jgi:nitrogen-specific signal transduction histidine kinase
MSFASPSRVFAGDSAMARLMAAHDWSRSPLGPPEQWPQSLRSVVDLMLGSAFPMFIAWGPSLTQLYNDGYVEIMGSKHPAGLARPLLENWAELRADLEPLIARALQGDAPYVENMPLRVRRGRGQAEDTWFTFSYSPARDDDGRIAGLFCACIETTRTVRAEQVLRDRSEWLDTLFHQAPGFAAVLRGPKHVFEMANEAYAQITGRRDLVGQPFADALPETVGQGWVDRLDKVYRSGAPSVGHGVPVVVNQSPDASPYDARVDFIFQPLRDATGDVEGILVQGYDVTEQHRAREALQAADRRKDEFLATLAHELRNPLAPMRTAAHLLEMPAATDAVRAKAAQMISRQVQHMARLLDDLMDVGRITQGRLLLQRERTTVGQVMDAAVEASRPLVDAKRHTLIVQDDDAGQPIVVDPVRITQVISNLLNNAAKYTDAGGRIRLDARVTAGEVEFSVSDNGIGLARGSVDSLFEMFAQQSNALARSEGGLGIGLALSKALVELHGGAITAHSEGSGLGSRFVVRLPLHGDA